MAAGGDAFYAVNCGRQRGVYRKWEDCEKQVKGFPKAKYKKFKTLAEAEAFSGVALASTLPTSSADPIVKQTPPACFYAVRAGRQPGIYRTWQECWNQTDEYKGAEYKKFKTLGLAQYYLSSGAPPPVSLDLPVAAPTAMSTSSTPSSLTVSSSATASPPSEFRIYTDGSCPDNVGSASKQGRAGWGFAVLGANEELDFYGPVVFDKNDSLFLGATCGTNNTGELCGIAMALVWLVEAAAKGPATILYDSKYAANIAQEKWKATQNVELARNVQACRRAVLATGRPLTFQKVKGHSGDAGNDRADHNADLGASGSLRCWVRPKESPIVPHGQPPILASLASAKRTLADDAAEPPVKRMRTECSVLSSCADPEFAMPSSSHACTAPKTVTL